MAQLTALRFTPVVGALAIDQESWYLRNRKTFFTDCLYSLLPPAVREEGFELIYGGIGHPAFHHEVVNNSRRKIEEVLQHNRAETLCEQSRPLQYLARFVLNAFQARIKRRIDDRLQFLYGLTMAEVGAGNVQSSGSEQNGMDLQQKDVVKRTLDIATGKESMSYGSLTVKNEAVLIGIDPNNGFSGFTLKEDDGVLSYHSCGFESLGPSRYIAASEISQKLHSHTLEERRHGVGTIPGLVSLYAAHSKAARHFGQVGGTIRCAILNADGASVSERLQELSDARSRLLSEIVEAYLMKVLTEEKTYHLVKDIIEHKEFDTIEKELFQSVAAPGDFDKIIRGYKTGKNGLKSNRFIEQCYR